MKLWEGFGIESLPWLPHVAVSTLISLASCYLSPLLKVLFTSVAPLCPRSLYRSLPQPTIADGFIPSWVYLLPNWVMGQTVPFLFQDLACEQ